MLNIKIKSKLLVTAAALLLGHASFVAQANTNPASTNLPNGAELEVEINNPIQNGEFKVPAASGPGGTIDVDVDGLAAVGQGVPNIDLVYVLDVSGSTVLNNCDTSRTILDCEVDAILNVQSSPNITSVKGVGVAIFADGGNTADMPGLLVDQTTYPSNVATVVNSAHSNSSGGPAGVTQFSPKTVGAGETDFSAGLQSATAIISTGSGTTRRVIFLSDGISSQASAPGGFAGQLAAMAATSSVVDAFAVGPNADCADGSAGTLQQIADATGGTCTNVPDPAKLPDILENLLFTSLESVQVAVDGYDVLTNTGTTLPADGPVNTTYDATPNLGVGDYNVTAAADGHDNAGSDQVVADVDIHLLQLTASPATAINDLNVSDSHTVTAAILGGTGDQRDISFLVGGQNVATATPGSGDIEATPGGEPVDFDYTVPQVCANLGTDTITVTAVIAGMEDSIVLEKNWIDPVPPNVSCVPTVNPHGNTKPAAPGQGGQGVNQDGFYQIDFDDGKLGGAECVTVVLTDGSGYVYTGPFDPEDNIKYTQDDSTPQEEKDMGSTKGKAGAVDWHLIGHGDLTVTVTDTSGNVSFASCLVPPAPQ